LVNGQVTISVKRPSKSPSWSAGGQLWHTYAAGMTGLAVGGDYNGMMMTIS
jgi:hypothetical protein